jgi:hypothetical protein
VVAASSKLVGVTFIDIMAVGSTTTVERVIVLPIPLQPSELRQNWAPSMLTAPFPMYLRRRENVSVSYMFTDLSALATKTAFPLEVKHTFRIGLTGIVDPVRASSCDAEYRLLLIE